MAAKDSISPPIKRFVVEPGKYVAVVLRDTDEGVYDAPQIKTTSAAQSYASSHNVAGSSLFVELYDLHIVAELVGGQLEVKPREPFKPHNFDLPENLSGHVHGMCCVPEEVDLARATEGATIAKRLQGLTGNRVEIYFDPGTFFNRDKAAQGHLYGGRVESDRIDDHLTLDDRKGNLAEQLANEAERIAKVYAGIAERVRKRIATGNIHGSLTAPGKGKRGVA